MELEQPVENISLSSSPETSQELETWNPPELVVVQVSKTYGGCLINQETCAGIFS